MSRIRKAVLPVAGLGSRFLPATKAVPKELLPIVDRPLLSYAIAEAQAAGIEEFVFVTARGKDAIMDYVDAAPETVRALEDAGKSALAEEVRATALAAGTATFVRQDRPLGLGHAVWCARHAVGDEPFAVMLPDDLILGSQSCLARMVEMHGQYGGHMVAAVDVPREQTGRYGILATAEDDGTIARATGLVEKPDPAQAPSTLAIIGRYVLGPEVFGELSAGRTGSGGEVQLTDAIAARIGAEAVYGVRFAGQRYDCGATDGFLAATVAVAMAREDLSGTMRRILSSYGDPSQTAA